ncbi:PEGA domain-containing protein [Candidatus Bipolaricaulota bacterium]|nr:PEGA domain-containing protein [Candidatus Bipolaricaulota bacterium]
MTNKRLVLFVIIIVIGLNFSPGFSQENEVEPKGIIPEPPGSPNMELDISTDKSRYLPEEEVKINYELNQEAYLYVFSIESDGEVNLLFPNKYDPDNQLTAGEGQLPGKGYSFLTGKTEGKEYFQAIASKKKLPVFPSPPSAGSDADPFPRLAVNPEKFEKSTSEKIKEAADESWVTDWTEIEVTKRPSRLSVSSTPSNAKIYIDDDFVGQTPATLDVRPGYRQVKLLLGTDLRWSEEIQVKPNQVKRLSPELERVDYATISIISDPSGARIYVDGQYRGETPRRISSEAKEITVELQMDGYPDWEREIRLYPNESRELKANLRAGVSPSATLDLDVSVGLGLNFGWFPGKPFSPGLELTVNDLIIGASFYGEGDSTLETMDINWKEGDFEGEKLDYGPEWEIYFGYPLEIYDAVYLRAGAGLAIQPQAQLEQLESGNGARSIEPMADVFRNAQLVFEVKPTIHGGLELERQGLSLQFTYQSRRGPVIGLGYEF